MSLTEERSPDTSEDTSELIRIPVAELAATLWLRRGWLIKITALGTLLAAAISFILPSQYQSTVQLMPPDPQSLTSASLLNGLGSTALVPSLGGSLMNSRTPGSTLIGVLSSRTAQDDIINQLHLLSVYHCNLYVAARKILAGRTAMQEDKKTGLISIVVTDHDRYRARDIAKAYVDEANTLLNAVNSSTARNERVFLQKRLESLKHDVDASAAALSQYSSRNATLNPQSQGQAMIEAAARLQGELITAQSELEGLKAQYSEDNVRVRGVRARIEELQSQLRKMGGIGEKQDGSELKPDQLFPSIRELPILGVTYSDLYRQFEMQESLYETLTKQYELSKVQEAKELPTIKILDEPDVPELKSFPSKRLLAASGALVSAFTGLVWIIFRRLWELAEDSGAAKSFVASVRGIVRAGQPVLTKPLDDGVTQD